MAKVKAKKSFGQHFLVDEAVSERIADTVLGYGADTPLGRLPIVEIGPGTGALTRWLDASGHELVAVELDPEAAAYMRKAYPGVKLIEEDFLKMNLDSVFPGQKIALIGNYPYNISTQIFFRVLEHRNKVALCSGMLQREVAERICAREGSKTYGILSVLLQLWYDCEYLFTVDETVFRPMPKVKSGVLRLLRNGRTELPCSEALLKNVVKTAFGQRRKTMRNSLGGLIGSLQGSTLPQGLDTPALKPFLPLRPEQISPLSFVKLTMILEGKDAEADVLHI